MNFSAEFVRNFFTENQFRFLFRMEKEINDTFGRVLTEYKQFITVCVTNAPMFHTVNPK